MTDHVTDHATERQPQTRGGSAAMAVTIRSLLTAGPLLVPLTGGGWVRLGPGEVTDELADVEVTNNAKIDKLRRRRLIEVKPVVEEAPGTSPGDEPESEAAAKSGAHGARSAKR
jgi:hypothetical protein